MVRRASVLLLLLASGCVGVAEAQPATGGACGSERWGGYARTPRCAALARRVLRGAHRSCSTNEDCAIIHQGSCAARAVRREHAARYEAMPPSCENPAAGRCARVVARCESHCCTTELDRANPYTLTD